MKVIDAARYLIYLANSQKKYSLTPLKLQKLLYFAQGWSYVWDNKALFNSEFEAWQYGPVHPLIYDVFKQYKNHEIPKFEGKSKVEANEDELETLNVIWDKYKEYSAFKLVDLSHQEQPWIDAFRQGRNIRNSELKDYYQMLYL